MSNRTLLEFNHDYCPNIKEADDVREWAEGIIVHLRTGDRPSLPNGVTFKHMRHHGEPDPLGATAPSLPSAEELAQRMADATQLDLSLCKHWAHVAMAALSSDKVSKEEEKK